MLEEEEEETDEKTTTGEQNFCQFKGAKFSFLAFSHSLSLLGKTERDERTDRQTIGHNGSPTNLVGGILRAVVTTVFFLGDR